jgi:hypothetical protein
MYAWLITISPQGDTANLMIPEAAGAGVPVTVETARPAQEAPT